VLDYLVVVMGGRVAEEIFLATSVAAPPPTSSRPPAAPGHGLRLGHERQARHGPVRRRLLHEFLRPRRRRLPWLQRENGRSHRRRGPHLVSSAYDKAREIIGSHREAMEKITAALLEYETLDGKHIKDIIEHGHMLTPPPAPLLRPPTDAQGTAPRQSSGQGQGRRRRHAPRPARASGVNVWVAGQLVVRAAEGRRKLPLHSLVPKLYLETHLLRQFHCRFRGRAREGVATVPHSLGRWLYGAKWNFARNKRRSQMEFGNEGSTSPHISRPD